MHDPGYFEDGHIGRISDLRLWHRILAFALPQWRWMVLAVLLSLVITGTGLVLPRLVQVSLDRYIVNPVPGIDERVAGVARMSAFFVLAVLLGFIANFIQVMVLERTGQRIMQSLRQGLFNHVVDLDLSFFNAHPVGRLVTRLTNDIQNMHEMFTSVIVTLFNEGIRLVGILAILFWMNWKLTLMLSLTFPLMVLITHWFGRLSRDAFRDIRRHLAGINAFIQETVSGISVIQLFLREEDIHDRFSELNRRYYDSAFYQIWIFGIFVPLIEVMSSVAMALIIWYGGGETLRNHMTIGILAAFISYMRLFFQPLRELSQKYSIVQSAMASAERIFNLMEIRSSFPAAADPAKIREVSGDVAFKKVVFEYEPDRPALRGLSFHVRPGETLAVVGATGSGKTTIINLLERFYDPASGTIELDGVDLRRIDPHWLREQIGLVMQDVFIVSGTLRENIVLDRRVSGEDLKRTIELSQLSGLVRSLPHGLETRIGDGGMDFSAGQKQLLALARVLVRNPRILVLDEATANVDTETEMLVEKAVRAALSNRTSIVVAHRLSTIRGADRILVMDRGRIVEEGTHEDLMSLHGIYSHLQSLQNGAGQ